MNINNWLKPRKSVYNQNFNDEVKRSVDMQMLSMLGLSSEDITKLEATMKALAAMPEKMDALTARIESLEKEVAKNGGTESGTGAGVYTELKYSSEHGTAIDNSGNITKF